MAARQLDRTSLSDHVDRLYRAAWALCGSREDAEDLVQETFARVMARPRWLRKDDDLGYLLRALRNTFLIGRRAADRRPVTEPLELRVGLLADNGARRPDTAVESVDVYRAIAALPIKCREALVAVDVIGLSYAEAARALRVPTATITSRLYRARMMVAARLRETEPLAPTAEGLSRDQVDEAAALQSAR